MIRLLNDIITAIVLAVAYLGYSALRLTLPIVDTLSRDRKYTSDHNLAAYRSINCPTPNHCIQPTKHHPGSAARYSSMNLESVSRILRENNIKHYWIPIESHNEYRSRLAVSNDSYTHVRRIFQRLGAQRSIFRKLLFFLHNIVTFIPARNPAPTTILQCYIWFRNGHATQISRKCSCEIDFFSKEPQEATFIHPNDVSKFIPLDSPIVAVQYRGVSLKTWQFVQDSMPLEKCSLMVDVVYTWVDGNDPEWLLEKMRYESTASETVHHSALSDSRFTSRNELKYSLRSLAYCTNFVRRIFIVTNGQVPSWLKVDNEKISMVTHSEIFRDPKNCLPTYNSHAIESNLHRIPGLSENFLYLNDDFCFYSNVYVSDFFTSQGLPLVFINRNGFLDSEKYQHPFVCAGKNTSEIIGKEFGLSIFSCIRHAPYAQTKSTLVDIENKYASYLRETENHKFRHIDDISLPASLAPYWGLASKTSVEMEYAGSYILLTGKLTMSLALLRLFIFKNRKYLCVNDGDISHSLESNIRINKYLKIFYLLSFPLKSEFEI